MCVLGAGDGFEAGRYVRPALCIPAELLGLENVSGAGVVRTLSQYVSVDGFAATAPRLPQLGHICGARRDCVLRAVRVHEGIELQPARHVGPRRFHELRQPPRSRR